MGFWIRRFPDGGFAVVPGDRQRPKDHEWVENLPPDLRTIREEVLRARKEPPVDQREEELKDMRARIAALETRLNGREV